MAVLEIVRMGHPALREIASPVPDDAIVSPAIAGLIEDMRDTLHDAGGIGLAAPQISRALQLAIVEIADPEPRYGEIETLPLTVFFNPRITYLPGGNASSWEGCLSIPGLRGLVERPQHLRVDYQGEDAQHRRMETTGFLSTVLQHEFDHLRGVLYIDHIKDTRHLVFEEEFRQYHQSVTREGD